MTIDEIFKDLGDKFGSRVFNLKKKSQNRGYIEISPKDVVEVVRYVFKDLGLRFNIASAVDDFAGIEILYHFTHDKSNIVVTLRTMLQDKADPHIDTITAVTRSAWWIEREMHELFGIQFDGNSDMRPLLLPDDWPNGVYPLRKDFISPKRESRDHQHKPENKQ